MANGTLFIIEAIDGGGKDTQANILSKYLGNCHVGRTPFYENDTGKLIKQHISSNKQNISEYAFQALMIANYIEYFDTVIRPELATGKDVIITRCTSSMRAYGSYFGANPKFLAHLEESFFSYLAHYKINHYEFVINLSVTTALKRIEARKGVQPIQEIFENKACLLHVAKELKKGECLTINGNRSIEEVALTIKNLVIELKEK